MKAKGPLFTLLAGLVLAAVLVVLNMNQTGGDKTAQTPAGNNAPAAQNPAGQNPADNPADQNTPAKNQEEQSPDKTPKKPAAPVEVTWAGDVKGGGASIAIVAKGDQAIAYVCDGRRAEAWLKGTAKDGKLELTGAKNASLTGTFGNGRAKGSVTAAGITWKFDVAAVKKPSGLYRATATVRGAKVVGGWVVLANGRQVGVLTVDGKPQAAPELDTAAGTLKVDGTTVGAGAVDPAAGDF